MKAWRVKSKRRRLEKRVVVPARRCTPDHVGATTIRGRNPGAVSTILTPGLRICVLTHLRNDGRLWLLMTALVAAALFHVHAEAQTYPTRPVRMIIPAGAGGITDILGRVIAAKLTDALGQQVIVDNRPGASGIVGSSIVAKSAPDGHTLLMVFPSHPVNPSLYPDIPFDTSKAFAPISMVSAVAPVLIVSSQSPAKSVQDLIALAKAKPGALQPRLGRQRQHGRARGGASAHAGKDQLHASELQRFAAGADGAPLGRDRVLSHRLRRHRRAAREGGPHPRARRRREAAHIRAARRAADR